MYRDVIGGWVHLAPEGRHVYNRAHWLIQLINPTTDISLLMKINKLIG